MAFGDFGRFGSFGARFGRPQPQYDPFATPELDEEQRKSLISSLGQQAVGGILATANLIDLPDSVVRDVIGLGTTGNLSKYNPLDQLLPWNWTKSEGRQ